MIAYRISIEYGAEQKFLAQTNSTQEAEYLIEQYMSDAFSDAILSEIVACKSALKKEELETFKAYIDSAAFTGRRAFTVEQHNIGEKHD